MIWLKLFLILISALTFSYFLLYVKQLRTIQKEVKKIVSAKLFFVSFLMIILSGGFGIILLVSLGFEAIFQRLF